MKASFEGLSKTSTEGYREAYYHEERDLFEDLGRWIGRRQLKC